MAGGIAGGAPGAKVGAVIGAAVGALVGASQSSATHTHDSIGRPVHTYTSGFGGAAQIYVVHDLPTPSIVLDVRIDGHLRAADIQFGEHHLVGLESFGTAPDKRYVVFVIGRNAGTPQIVGSLVFCVTPKGEPTGENILLHIIKLNPPGRDGGTCR